MMRCARVGCHSASFLTQHHFAPFILRGLRCRVHSVFSVVCLESFVESLCHVQLTMENLTPVTSVDKVAARQYF